MFACKRTSQKGFSLVELMVVVAIIGVLASIAVPQVNKFIAKARQSEAKTNLSSYYTSQKAFQSEYGVFDPRFLAIGFSPAGELRYNVGVTQTAPLATPANGFNGTIVGTDSNAMAYCAAATAAIGAAGCKMLLGAGGAAVPALTGTAFTATTFNARATAVIVSGAVADVWQINQNKQISNPTNGIP